MAVIRITREFSFEMAHALEGYDGACRHIHGHSYRLQVTVSGTPSGEPSDPKCGMVMDFGLLKRIVGEQIIARYDHALAMRRTEANAELVQQLSRSYDSVIQTPFQPTSENLLLEFVRLLRQALPDSVQLVSVRLCETASSWAEWRAEDNC